MLDRFHCFTAESSDGKERVEGYAHSQMMKFLLGWLIEQECDTKGNPRNVQKKGPDGKPVTARVIHEHREFDLVEEARAKGLKMVRLDEKGRPKEGQEKPYTKYYGVVPQTTFPGWRVEEIAAPRELTAEEVADAAEAEAKEAVAAAKAAQDKAAAAKAALKKKENVPA